MRLAIDAMGGDHAPEEIVAGAVASLSVISEDDSIVLVGQEDLINSELRKHPDCSGDSKLEVVHASQRIEMADNPVDALRHKKDSSISKMVSMAASKEVDAMISAGNTGACVAACQMQLRTLQGVSRPGIAVVVPSFSGPVVLCDVGANPAPKVHHMHHYALMASIYAEVAFKLDRAPRVALLSIGEEDAKGSPLVKQVREIIKNDNRINFTGFVEGRSILSGQADVVICDGFVGNVVLKLIEGLADGLVKMVMREVANFDPEKVKTFEPILKHLVQKHDYREHGGAPLLGVDGIFITCHGSSNARAIKSAAVVACRLAKSNINERIVEYVNNEPSSETMESS